MIICSKTNPRIKKTKKLLQKKYRKDSYLIEGWHLFEEAQKANQNILAVFLLEEVAELTNSDYPVYIVSPEVLKELTETPSPQGIVAEIAMPNHPLSLEKRGKYLLLEDIQDPGNLGTMIRTADAAALDGVILSEKTVDIYNQKTLRSMQGSHFHLPIWRTDVYHFCRSMQSHEIPILGTTLSKDSIDYKALRRQDSFVLVMGNEGRGISDEMAALANQRIHITMPGQAESLNVAVAAGILIFSLI